jgi:predicted nucleotide-binding protein
MTPDDVGRAKIATAAEVQPRARQNVILEMGMLLSSLTRERVAILVKGHVEKPTDIDGILYIGFNDHVKETLPKLAQHLRQCGFTIDVSKVA